MEVLKFTCSMEIGIKGTDTDQENLLSRALNTLLREGKPIKWFSSVILEANPTISDPKWLGVFVHSVNDRIIFFPSFFDQYSLYKGQSLQRTEKFKIDHISLEKDRNSWHITSPNSRLHQGGFKPLSLGEGRILWFGLSLKSNKVLRTLYQDTEIIVKSPRNDSDRRLDIFKDAEIPPYILKLPHKADNGHSTQFIHLSIIIGPKDFPLYRGSNLALPINSPFLKDDLQKEISQCSVRLHRISLGNKYDVQIVAMYLPGSLTVPVTLTSNTT